MPALNETTNKEWCTNRALTHFGQINYLNQKINTKNKFEWKCEFQHLWKCDINNMKSKDTWCPTCTKGISEKYVGYALNQLFGTEYLFLTKQLDCLRDVRNMNCDLVNEELDIYIEVMGWATHSETKDPHMMKLSSSTSESYDKRDKIKKDKMKDAGLPLIYIPHNKYEGFDVIGERIYIILKDKYEHLFVISKEELLANLPNKAEVARHYHNRRKKEVENELEFKGCRLHTFNFAGRKDANISVYCSQCDEGTKLWSFDDIMRTDTSARKLLCDNCRKNKQRTIQEYVDICLRHNLTYVKHYKKSKAHGQTVVFTCTNDNQTETRVENLLKQNYKCKCGKC